MEICYFCIPSTDVSNKHILFFEIMDFQFYLKILTKRKWLILSAFLLPAILAFLLVSQKEKTYKSETIITSGLIGNSLDLNAKGRAYIQDILIKMNFSTIIEKVRNKSMLRLLAYDMLVHDLSNPDKAFRKLSPKVVEELPKGAISKMVNLLTQKLNDLDSKVLPKDEEELFQKLAKDLEYDRKSIEESLEVKRKGETDYISIAFESEDPYLSAHLAQTLTDDFLRYNKKEESGDHYEKFQFAEIQEREKKKYLDSLNTQLNFYKKKRAVLDVDVQAQGTVQQIQNLEMMRERVGKKIPALKKSIAKLNTYIDEGTEKTVETTAGRILKNQDILNLKARVADLNDQYLSTGDEEVKKKLNIARLELDEKMGDYVKIESSELSDLDEQMGSDLLAQRIKMEMELVDAEETVKSINRSLAAIRGKASGLVGDMATVGNLESEVKIAEEAYELARNKLNDAKVTLEKAYHPISTIENAQVPDEPESSHKGIISVFSGVLGGSFAILSLFLLAFFDKSLGTPGQFHNFTNTNLVGVVNDYYVEEKDLKELFSSKQTDESAKYFVESIRKLRHQLEESGSSIFLFTSTQPQQGKTYLMINLAYALTLKGKKVLLVDTNFKNNTLSRMSEANLQSNSLASRLISENNLENSFETASNASFSLDNIDIIGNNGGFSSPAEKFSGTDFSKFLEAFLVDYDYIFLEGPALNLYSDAQELVPYVEKVVAVYSADMEMGSKDKESSEYLKSQNAKFIGGILNKVDITNVL